MYDLHFIRILTLSTAAVVLIVGACLLLTMKRAEKLREELKRYPSLRRFQRYRLYFMLPWSLATLVPAMCRIAGWQCPLGVALAVIGVQLIAFAGTIWILVIQERERKHLRQQDAEAGDVLASKK